MLEKLLLEALNLQPDKINKKERICFSFGGNTGLICDLFDAKKNSVDKSKSECITVNGLELSPLTKKYFEEKLGLDKFNEQQSRILKVRGTLDPVSSIETGVSRNTIFFETDNSMHNPHGAYSIMTDNPPTKFVSYRSVFLSYFFEIIKKYIAKNKKNDWGYKVVHNVLSFFHYGICHNYDDWTLTTGLFVFLKAGFSACAKTAGYCVKSFFVFVFSRKKNNKEIKIIYTPEKEKPKEENHSKENKRQIDTPMPGKEELKIPKMENFSYEKDKAIG